MDVPRQPSFASVVRAVYRVLAILADREAELGTNACEYGPSVSQCPTRDRGAVLGPRTSGVSRGVGQVSRMAAIS